MGKRMRFMTGAAVGAGMQYLYDPQAGRSRRARLSQQAASKVRKAGRFLSRKARYERGRLQGRLHDATS